MFLGLRGAVCRLCVAAHPSCARSSAGVGRVWRPLRRAWHRCCPGVSAPEGCRSVLAWRSWLGDPWSRSSRPPAHSSPFLGTSRWDGPSWLSSTAHGHLEMENKCLRINDRSKFVLGVEVKFGRSSLGKGLFSKGSQQNRSDMKHGCTTDHAKDKPALAFGPTFCMHPLSVTKQIRILKNIILYLYASINITI